MQIFADSPDAYVAALPEERQSVINQLRKCIKDVLPRGFEETVGYGMLGYVVPHKLYPSGYHCDPKQPLPFMGLASQKNFVAFYHMGIYADSKLLEWFVGEYPKHCKTKLDMGKSCIRFKKMNDIPYDLISQLAARMTPAEWIALYESKLKR